LLFIGFIHSPFLSTLISLIRTSDVGIRLFKIPEVRKHVALLEYDEYGFSTESKVNKMISKNWMLSLALVIAASTAFAQDRDADKHLDLLGDAAPVAAAQRTIVITPDTKYVNVTGGEIVKFVVNNQTFAWHFDVAFTVTSFELNLVAPAGMLSQKVIANVERDPMYRNP